jgi:hypothetical protein
MCFPIQKHIKTHVFSVAGNFKTKIKSIIKFRVLYALDFFPVRFFENPKAVISHENFELCAQ